MPWPSKIITSFEIAKPEGAKDESRFYGPYNGLLYYLFPFEQDFFVVPQKRPRQSHFFMEIKASNHIQQISTRKDADKQMRERIETIKDGVNIDTLYGISALGTRLCLYTVQRGSGHIEPEAIIDNPVRITDTAPIGRWNIDILDPEGEKRVREVVAHINAMCAEL